MIVTESTITCAVCGQEVRYGIRGDRSAWWHRDDRPDPSVTIDRRLTADGQLGHEPVLGHQTLLDFSKLPPMKAAKDSGESDDRVFEIPQPDVWALPIDIDDERMPGGATKLIKPAVKCGGEVTATYSRGPRTHASNGNLLGMSDFVMVKFFTTTRSVAMWADGSFEYGYTVDIRPDLGKTVVNKVNSKALRAWILRGA